MNQIEEVAPDVIPQAQEKTGLVNPFISFKSLETLCQGDETLDGCLREVVFDSLRYTETICLFKQIVARGQQSNEDDTRKQIEHTRSTIHDATIVSINILIRSLRAAGKDTTWATKMRQADRAGYAKFAILIAFEFVLKERK
jgi:hypothetical protein